MVIYYCLFLQSILVIIYNQYYYSIEPGEFTEWKLGDKNGPMIAALSERKIDLAATPAQMTIDRWKYVSSPTSPWPFRY